MKLKSLTPWLVAVGFALLFLSTSLIQKYQQPLGLTSKQPVNDAQTIPTPTSIPSTTSDVESGKVKVTRIIDGDTIELSDNTRIRYTGVDTPETGDCYGASASKANSNLVLNKEVILETDVQILDKYGRKLAYVWLDPDQTGVKNILVNEELVKQGVARVSTYPPNVKYVERFQAAEREAREGQFGLWSPDACIKREIRTEGNGSEHQGARTNNECTIKGNISSSGEKIYHTQGQRYYEKTKIEESAGERWFCSESEAESAGWRKSKV
ncbi:MAG: micrococcal nuclease [Microgenomates group bacterium Gr01-1014_5]|nr:MAG: micrococcal nuclease [Microgenomates group bacterium Gr01-1014_5]